MGLVTNIEHWDMSAAIGMATEGIRARYNDGAGGGGFGAADIEIGSKLDCGKVLAAVDRMAAKAQHLADWSMFAYASPMWNSRQNRDRLIEHVLNDWMMAAFQRGEVIQRKTFERMRVLVPELVGSLALEQTGGARVYSDSCGDVQYQPILSRAHLIQLLAEHDSQSVEQQHEKHIKKRKLFYQCNWQEWQERIDSLRTLLVEYDQSAREVFQRQLSKLNR